MMQPKNSLQLLFVLLPLVTFASAKLVVRSSSNSLPGAGDGDKDATYEFPLKDLLYFNPKTDYQFKDMSIRFVTFQSKQACKLDVPSPTEDGPLAWFVPPHAAFQASCTDLAQIATQLMQLFPAHNQGPSIVIFSSMQHATENDHWGGLFGEIISTDLRLLLGDPAPDKPIWTMTDLSSGEQLAYLLESQQDGRITVEITRDVNEWNTLLYAHAFMGFNWIFVCLFGSLVPYTLCQVFVDYIETQRWISTWNHTIITILLILQVICWNYVITIPMSFWVPLKCVGWIVEGLMYALLLLRWRRLASAVSGGAMSNAENPGVLVAEIPGALQFKNLSRFLPKLAIHLERLCMSKKICVAVASLSPLVNLTLAILKCVEILLTRSTFSTNKSVSRGIALKEGSGNVRLYLSTDIYILYLFLCGYYFLKLLQGTRMTTSKQRIEIILAGSTTLLGLCLNTIVNILQNLQRYQTRVDNFVGTHFTSILGLLCTITGLILVSQVHSVGLAYVYAKKIESVSEDVSDDEVMNSVKTNSLVNGTEDIEMTSRMIFSVQTPHAE